MTARKPVALANWKMEMTIADSLAYLGCFRTLVAYLFTQVDIILCPPYTALYAMSRQLMDSPLLLAAQTISTEPGGARTGEISAQLAADAGARGVLLGHWELRRRSGETDQDVNQKLLRAFEAGLQPVLLVGEARGTEQEAIREALDRHLAAVLDGCSPGQRGDVIYIYEPEGSIGQSEPASAAHIGMGCRLIRRWLAERAGPPAAAAARVLYGGSITPDNARDLLAVQDLDGFGAGRSGRDPEAFGQIVQLLAEARPI